MTMSGDTFGRYCWEVGATGIYCVQIRGAAKSPVMPRIAPTAKNYPTPNVNHGSLRKPAIG